MKTVGISPKAVLAAVVPTLGGVIAVAVQWLVTGELDRAELGTAVGTVAAALLAFLGAYAGSPGNVPAAAVPATFATPMTSGAAAAISGAIGGNVGLGYTTPTGTSAYAYPSDDEPGDPDALPDYRTDTDPPPDEGDTSATGDSGERES